MKYLRTATVGNCTHSTPSVVAAAATATATARRHEARPVAHVSVWAHSLSGSPGSLAKRYLQVPPHTRSVGIPCSCPIHLQQPAPASLSPSHALLSSPNTQFTPSLNNTFLLDFLILHSDASPFTHSSSLRLRCLHRQEPPKQRQQQADPRSERHLTSSPPSPPPTRLSV